MSNVSKFISQVVYLLVKYTENLAADLQTNYYTKSEIDDMDIEHQATWHVVIVNQLPQSGTNYYLYLVPNSLSLQNNVVDEYLWATDKFEKIGSIQYDMVDYYTKTETNNLLNDKKSNMHIPDKLSDFIEDISYINLVKTSRGICANINGTLEVLCASDIISRQYMEENYYQKSGIPNKQQFEDGIANITNRINNLLTE